MQGKMHNFSIKIDKKADTGDYKLTLIGESITAWENDAVSHDATMKEYVVIKSTPGELKDAIIAANKDYTKLRNLKITGQINSHDFDFMRDEMSSLSSLNLKEVKIKGMNQWGEADDNYDDKIPFRAFFSKSSLVSVVLPDKLKVLGAEAFCGCGNLTGSVIVPEGVVEVGDGAFWQCGNLTGTLSLPSTLEKIGARAFGMCGFVCELNIPEKVKEIGWQAFVACGGIHGELHLPSGLETLGRGAFQEMPNMTGSITIPQGVKRKLTI